MASRVVRRLDNLGRIVIPKEVRRDLKIKGNEKIEISVLDDKIVLNKYSDINSFDKNIEYLIDIIKKVYDRDIIITNLNNIVLTSDKYKNYINLEISSKLEDILDDRESVYENIPVSLKICKDLEDIKVSYIIKPIIIKGDLIGLIILLTNSNLENTDLKIIEFLDLYLENYLE